MLLTGALAEEVFAAGVFVESSLAVVVLLVDDLAIAPLTGRVSVLFLAADLPCGFVGAILAVALRADLLELA